MDLAHHHDLLHLSPIDTDLLHLCLRFLHHAHQGHLQDHDRETSASPESWGLEERYVIVQAEVGL